MGEIWLSINKYKGKTIGTPEKNFIEKNIKILKLEYQILLEQKEN